MSTVTGSNIRGVISWRSIITVVIRRRLREQHLDGSRRRVPFGLRGELARCVRARAHAGQLDLRDMTEIHPRYTTEICPRYMPDMRIQNVDQWTYASGGGQHQHLLARRTRFASLGDCSTVGGASGIAATPTSNSTHAFQICDGRA